MRKGIRNIRVLGPAGAPVGFYVLEDDELHQLFVAAAARGTGAAAILIADAEAQLFARGGSSQVSSCSFWLSSCAQRLWRAETI